jgi:hypothetical protein
MLKICLARNATFWKLPLVVAPPNKRIFTSNKGLDNLMNIDNYLMTSAQKDSSKDVPTPNILPPFSSSST